MKKIISVILVLFLLCGSVYSSNLPQLNVAYDRETGTVSVTGSITGTVQKVTLMVLRPNASVDAMDAGTAGFFTSAIHADEATVTEGTYTFSDFDVSVYDPGVYTIRVSDGKNVWEKTINAATEAQTLDLIKNAKTPDDVSDCITRYNDIYGLDISENSLFSKLDAIGQQETLTRIANANPQNKAELKTLFDRNNLLYKIYQGPWTALGTLLTDHASLLGIDASLLNSVSDASNVYKSLCGTLFQGTADFGTAYLTAISQNQAVIPGGGFVSGGGGGGGGGAAYMPPVTPNPDNKPQTTPQETDTFSDVPNTHWAFDSVTKLSKKAIINGKGENLFVPEDKVTRAEAVKMIVLTFLGETASEPLSFADLKESDWAYPYISTAVSNHIVTGYSNTLFGKDDFVTRQDLAVMIYRAASAKNMLASEATEQAFSDADSISDYAKTAVNALANANIINGYNGFFLPGANATRAETAKMLAAFLGE